MKLAEALILRADYQKRVEQLKQRILRNAKVQEGDSPAEDPEELLKELEDIARKLEDLIQRINRTNSATIVGGKKTLADMIVMRDQKKLLQGVYRDLAQAATITQGRLSRAEVKFRSTVGVKAIQRQADNFAREYRELDMEIQETNWKIELKE